jgi:hypothetical protein
MGNQAVSTHAMGSTQTSNQPMETFAAMAPIPFPIAAIVRRASDVEALRKLRSARRMHILLRISGLPTEASKQWEAKLNSSLRECGCSLGAKCVMAAFVASLVWQSEFSHWGISHWPVFLLRTFLLILAAGAVGKSAGKLRARVEIRAIEKKIHDFERKYAAGG